MLRLDEVAGIEVTWTQPQRGTAEHELRAGDALVATLSHLKGGKTFLVVTAEGTWTFTRDGFWHPRVTIRQQGAEADLAILEFGGRNGTLRAGATTVAWKVEGLLRPGYAWLASDGSILMRFKHAPGGLLRMAATLELDSTIPTVPPREMLACLGWYLIVMSANDDASTTAAIAATM